MKLVNKEYMLLSFPTTERWISVFKEWFSFLFFPRVKLTFALIKYWDFCFGFMLHHLFASLEWRRIFLAFRLHNLPVAGTYSVPLHSAEQIEAWWLRCENVFRCASVFRCANVFRWLQLHPGVLEARHLPTTQTTELPFLLPLQFFCSCWKA